MNLEKTSHWLTINGPNACCILRFRKGSSENRKFR